MATAKKSTNRKATPKKSATNKPAARKRAASPTKTKSVNSVRSFRVSQPTRPFMTFSFTRESSYWLVLGIVVVSFGWWIMQLQSDIQAIYDSIDANSNTVITQPAKKR